MPRHKGLADPLSSFARTVTLAAAGADAGMADNMHTPSPTD
ncbi:hypothetical protein AB0G32_15245 [Streptomyces sp. NPDC023723]